MDREQNRTAWIIAGLLAVLLIVAVFMWMNTREDLEAVLMQGNVEITNIRDKVARDCAEGTDTARCQDALAELEDILLEFRRDVQEATTTEPATTTP